MPTLQRRLLSLERVGLLLVVAVIFVLSHQNAVVYAQKSKSVAKDEDIDVKGNKYLQREEDDKM